MRSMGILITMFSIISMIIMFDTPGTHIIWSSLSGAAFYIGFNIALASK